MPGAPRARQVPWQRRMRPSPVRPCSAPPSGTMNNMRDDTSAMVQAIIAHHAATFAGFGAEPAPKPTRQEAAYLAALQACSTLGFIAHDAEHLGLYAVLPDADWVGRMARAGVPTVQLRFKSDNAAAIEREVHAAVRAVQGTGALLFINDHWRTAIQAGAYGIHLGQEDLDALAPDELQALRASGLRLGVSTHGYAEMVRADAVGPSFIAMGAVFPTTLKKMATAPQGVGRFGVYARLLRHYPQVAIGGIGAEQFAPVQATGVGSIAVVRALVNAPDPEATATHLMRQMEQNSQRASR